MRKYPSMKTLILALAATLITAPAVAADSVYYKGSTKRYVDSCSMLLRYSAPPPPDQVIPDFGTVIEEANVGKRCLYAAEAWLGDTGRFKPASYPGSEAEQDKEIVLARCIAQIILRYNNDTSVADALAAEFDTACGEPPAIM